jgi:hypothetical protein
MVEGPTNVRAVWTSGIGRRVGRLRMKERVDRDRLVPEEGGTAL